MNSAVVWGKRFMIRIFLGTLGGLAVLFQTVFVPADAAIDQQIQFASGTVVSRSGDRLEIQPDSASATKAREFTITSDTRVFYLANRTDASALSPGAQAMIKYVARDGRLMATEVRLARLGPVAPSPAAPRSGENVQTQRGSWRILDAHIDLSGKPGAPAATHLQWDQPYYIRVRVRNTTPQSIKMTLECGDVEVRSGQTSAKQLSDCDEVTQIVAPGDATITAESQFGISKSQNHFGNVRGPFSALVPVNIRSFVIVKGMTTVFMDAGTQQQKIRVDIDDVKYKKTRASRSSS